MDHVQLFTSGLSVGLGVSLFTGAIGLPIWFGL